MRLVLDIGNTRTKWGAFDGLRLVEHGVVASEAELAALRARYGTEFVLRAGEPTPLRGGYPTLGADRIAACVAVSARYPGCELLIVDFGTAITYDRVSAGRAFLGGAISPGMAMRFSALAAVAALPAVDAGSLGELWAKSTPEAISAGVVEGICFEVQGFVDAFLEAAGGEAKIIFTGGDAELFAKRIKNAIFVPCQWVLEGLNLIANEK